VVLVVLMVVQQVEPHHVKIVSLIGLHTVLSAAIQHGMSLVLTARHLKVHTAGIALVVAVQVMVKLSVVMEIAQVTRPMKIALQIALSLQDVKSLVEIRVG
jgi:hypothetical protein